MSEQLAVDVDALRRGGVNIDEISETCRSIHGELYAAVTQYADAGGDGDIGKSMKQNYEPGRDDCLQFLGLLGQSLSLNGERTVKLGGVLGSTDAGATEIANSHGKVH
jgi:hypothetical protein